MLSLYIMKQCKKKVEELGIEYSQGYYFFEPKEELLDESDIEWVKL